MKGVARLKAVRLVLGQDEWDSSLSQVAGTNAKHRVRLHLHLSKFFFIIIFNDVLGIQMERDGEENGG